MRKLQLANGLQVYLVSDPGTEAAAASMTVRAGSWQDLPEFAGTAHFLEHMLFMGTRQYPDEAEYQKFLRQHGGYSNAYTAADHTCYLFSCDNAALDGALQRFAGFFTDPMLKSSCIERESMAVDSEYRGDIDHEGWRAMHVQATQNNPAHPASRFTIGSVDTLKGLDSATLRKWYEAHYSANLMHLVVYSPLSLDALQAQVIDNFSKVPNHNLASQHLDIPMFDAAKLGTLLFAETDRKGSSTLAMRWEIPYDLATDHAAWPATLVSHALGQEGAGSLLSTLKELGLATGVSTGEQHELPGNAIMQLQVSLTDKGVAEYEKVAELCYAAIGQVQRHGISRAVFDDLAAAGKRDFAFQTRRDAYKTVEAHARGLLEAPLASYQDALVAPTEYRPEAIAAVANAMTPQACQFMLLAHPDTAKRHGAEKEPWLGVPYSAEKLPADKLAAWAKAAPPTPDFALPRANPFMPKQLGVLPLTPESPTERRPQRVVADDHMTVFAARDVHEHTPRVSWTIDILTPELKEPSAKTQVLRDLYLTGVNDALVEVMAEAQVAGMGAGVSATAGGVRVSLSGYNDRAPALLDAVLSKLQSSMPTAQRFSDMAEEMAHAYADARLGSPISQAMEQLDAVRRSHFVSQEDREEALRTIQYGDVQAFGQQLLATTHVQASLVGNQCPEAGAGGGRAAAPARVWVHLMPLPRRPSRACGPCPMRRCS